MKKTLLVVLLAGSILFYFGSVTQAVSIYSYDFIDDAQRTNFVSFDGLPTSGPGFYEEDGIRLA